jgi:hypothetical protein
MTLTEAIFVIIGGASAIVGGIISCVWWVYRRGEQAGEQKILLEVGQRAQEKAEIKLQSLEQRLTEIQAALDIEKPRRRHI